MIYYFSGTGNSEWVARQIAAGTGMKLDNIARLIHSTAVSFVSQTDGIVGFVFPIHAWGAPDVVLEFTERLNIQESTYRFAIATCGDEAGCALNYFSKKFPLHSAWSIRMPNNYIPMADIDKPEQIRRKIDEANRLIPEICNCIQARQSVWQVHKGSFANLKSRFINPLFRNYALSAKSFYAEDHCTSCGICVQACPMENIELKEGRPIWADHCVQCMSCIHRCPVQAIQIGMATKTRGRYTFEAYETGKH